MIKNEPIITDVLYENGLEFSCPYCSSNSIITTDHVMTLLGGNPDPNHHWHTAQCRDCNQDFGMEHKLKHHNKTHIWYTKKN